MSDPESRNGSTRSHSDCTKTDKSEYNVEAIPTIYRGIQLRSRMEAQCAVLFDRLGWKWEYEPYSYMLPSGLTFRPDFWIPEHRTFVECRGYCSERGENQLTEFGVYVHNRKARVGKGRRKKDLACQFVVVSESGSRGYSLWRGPDGPFNPTLGVILFRCGYCSEWGFVTSGGTLCVPCLYADRAESQSVAAADVAHIRVESGRLFFRNEAVGI